MVKMNKMRNDLNELPIDYEKTKDAFKMRDIDNELKTMDKYLGYYEPIALKSKFIIFVTFIMLFFFSWKLALFIIGAFIVYCMINLCLE